MLTPRWFQMKPLAEAGEILATDARFIFILAGRRAYKTEISKRKLVLSLPMDVGWDQPRYFYSAPTRQQAKDIAWDDLKALTPRDWMAGPPSETELKIKTVFGSTLQVIGLDQPQRIEGGGYNGGVVDERSDVKPRALNISIYPTLADRNGWLIQTGVGKRQGVGAKTFFDDFAKAQTGELKNAAAYRWPSSAVLEPEQLEDFKRLLDDKDYREQFEAEQVRAGGTVFYNWDDSNVIPCEYDPDIPLHIGSDFNVDPMCWVICQVESKTVRVIDEIWKRDTNTEQTLDELWRRYSLHRSGFYFYGDAAGRARKTSASASDYILITNDTRFDQYRPKAIRYPLSNPRQHDRVSSTVAAICNAQGKRALFVDPNCKKLIDDLESRVYKEYSSDFDDGPMMGHMTDALGYFIHAAFPRRMQTGNYSSSVVAVS